MIPSGKGVSPAILQNCDQGEDADSGCREFWQVYLTKEEMKGKPRG